MGKTMLYFHNNINFIRGFSFKNSQNLSTVSNCFMPRLYSEYSDVIINVFDTRNSYLFYYRFLLGPVCFPTSMLNELCGTANFNHIGLFLLGRDPCQKVETIQFNPNLQISRAIHVPLD